jgi:hypothetical protein
MTSQPTVVVLGFIGRMPVAGVAWQALHYLEGLRRCGSDVYYIEDTGDWPYDPQQNAITADGRYTVRYLSRVLGWCGLEGRWAYRAESEGGRYYGMSEGQVTDLFRSADVLLNLTGSTVLRDEYCAVPIRIYLETDPVLPQIEVAQGRRFTIDFLAAHTHHFSFGENLGAADCGVPVGCFTYEPTRQPVILDWWQANTKLPWGRHSCLPTSKPRSIAASPAGCLTTVACWQQSGKDFEWQGEQYLWSKHHEFLKFLDLPLRSGRSFELALSSADADAVQLLTRHGWRVADALQLSLEMGTYHAYILASRGEFTVAKDQNIRLQSGWFSDRSACYLAAGRPVITQDTGFGKVVPTGQGLFAFRRMEDILSAVEAIDSDYERHCRAAREIAAEYFAAEKVVGEMMTRAAA